MPDRNHVHILLVLILVAAAALVGLFMGASSPATSRDAAAERSARGSSSACA